MRKRARKPAAAERDLAYKPSRTPVFEPRSSPYNIRQGDVAVSLVESGQAVSEGLREETVRASEEPVSEQETLSVEGDLEGPGEMAGRGNEVGDMMEVLRIMSERDAQFRQEQAAAAEERRKEEEIVEAELRRVDEEARRLELREMFRQMNGIEPTGIEQKRLTEERQRRVPGRKGVRRKKRSGRKGKD